MQHKTVAHLGSLLEMPASFYTLACFNTFKLSLVHVSSVLQVLGKFGRF